MKAFSDLKMLALVIMSVFLTGCAHKEPLKEVVYEIKTIYVKPSPEQLKPVVPPKPIKKEEYLLLKPYEKELYLGDLVTDLYRDVAMCNAQLHSIGRLSDKVSKEKP